MWAAVTEAVEYGSGTVIRAGHISRVDHDAFAALSSPRAREWNR